MVASYAAEFLPDFLCHGRYDEDDLHYVLWGNDPARQNTSTKQWCYADFRVYFHRVRLMAKLRAEIAPALDQMRKYRTAKQRYADVVHASLTVERSLPPPAVLILEDFLQGP